MMTPGTKVHMQLLKTSNKKLVTYAGESETPDHSKIETKDFIGRPVKMIVHNSLLSHIKEEAPANSSGAGNIAGIGIGQSGEPGIKKKKKILNFRRFIKC